jgi:hypothetical protein
MTALTKNVTRKREVGAFDQLTGNFGSGNLDPTAVFYQGALCIYDTSDDLIKPAETTTTGIALGVANYYVQAGEAKDPWIDSGTRPFANSTAGDLIANANAGATCYIVDDNTVALTDGTGTRSAAGKIIRVDSDGVWVAVNPYDQ